MNSIAKLYIYIYKYVDINLYIYLPYHNANIELLSTVR